MTFRRAFLPLMIAAVLSPVAAGSAATRGFEVRDLATLDRVSAPTLSPDGRRVVFARRVVDYAANKSATSLWIEDLFVRAAAPPVRLTPEDWNVNSPAFSPDGRSVYFLSAKSGSSQLYSIAISGGAPRQLTALPVDVGSFKVSPDGKRVAFGAETFADCKADLACTKKRMDERGQQKNTGMVFDRNNEAAAFKQAPTRASARPMRR